MAKHVTDEETRETPCPRSNCSAKAGETCKTALGLERPRFHSERVKAARDARPSAKDRV